MKVKQVRAVVRREGLPTATTEWFPLGSTEAIAVLIELLPVNGETFMVVWKEREVEDTKKARAAKVLEMQLPQELTLQHEVSHPALRPEPARTDSTG
jgi:hypothetical protein